MALPLNTNLPLRIIGIQVFEDTCTHIRKSILPGWYPFIRCKKDIGTERKTVPLVAGDVCPYGFYHIEEGLPRISISAIAGKNGSGKSSLLDILYRILNNFTSAMLIGKPGDVSLTLNTTRGLYARLHFELDGVQKYIDVEDEKVSYYELDGNHPIEMKLYGLTEKERTNLLNRFFYTISVNYSIYAFNPTDYEAPLGKTDNLEMYNGDWLESLFHKNDGYFIPLVLTPFRSYGEMKMGNENVLAAQRINVLSILYHSQKKEFLDDYIPYKLCYKIDKGYIERKKLEINSNGEYAALMPVADSIIEGFKKIWKKYFEEEKIKLSADEKDVELFYFAYKSLKICLIYPEYKELFDLDGLLKLARPMDRVLEERTGYHEEHEEGDNTVPMIIPSTDGVQWVIEHINNLDTVVKAIIREDDRHITAKIHQCITYMKGERYKTGDYIFIDDLIDKRYELYDEVMRLMPPPFYQSEIHYIKKGDKRKNPEEITLKMMSSGEKQLLYSLSYIYYHIKNIASNKKDGKRIVGYHHINLIFDEAELYYHPEFQRIFVKRLLERLAMCHINKSNIRSINIMIVTHSPFILSDVPDSNILYLGNEDAHRPCATFGANIYDLLQDSFFLRQDIGDVASMKVQEMIKLFNEKDTPGRKDAFVSKYDEYEYVTRHLGEAYLKKTYEYMFYKLQEQYKPEKAKVMWRKRLEEIEREKEELTSLLEQ